MTKDELDRLAALCDAATPGPWAWQSHENRLWAYDTLMAPTGPIVIPDWQAVSEIEVASGMDVNDHDAAFIAESRTALPALLDALDAAEAEIERMRGEPTDRRCGTCAAWRHIEDDEGLCLALPMIQGTMTHMNRDGDQCALWRERGEG